ncbi:hypothetical protein M2373_002637 [Chryseobacterium sp. JUb7]|nr:hypothetical protein [Chryseobacterium sp. JUb7]
MSFVAIAICFYNFFYGHISYLVIIQKVIEQLMYKFLYTAILEVKKVKYISVFPLVELCFKMINNI